MSEPLNFQDNSIYNLIEADEAKMSDLNIIANKTIGELINENENLLVFSSDDKDRISEQIVFGINSTKTLCLNNVVGFVGVNDLKINIGSRFSEENGKQYFIQYMLQKIQKLNLFDFKTTYNNTNIWEQLLYLIFPTFLKRAYHQGIFKVYQKKNYNDSNLKGRIDIQRHLKQNLPFFGNIAYSNRDLSLNNPVTHLIRHTIEFITAKGYSSVFTNNYILNSAVQLIRMVTPDYNLKDRQRLVLINYKRLAHPFFTEYEPLRKLCIQILSSNGLSFSNSQNNKVYGLLIDAAWLWEEYLDTILGDLDFAHPENKTGKGKLFLFSKSQEIYPDFYHQFRKIVIDAKYKKLQDENKLNREDIYQVVTYMYRLQSMHGVLLYPANTNSLKDFEMNEESFGGKCALFSKYGMKVPTENSDYREYIRCFMDSELDLIKYFR